MSQSTVSSTVAAAHVRVHDARDCWLHAPIFDLIASQVKTPGLWIAVDTKEGETD